MSICQILLTEKTELTLKTNVKKKKKSKTKQNVSNILKDFSRVMLNCT